MAARPHPAGRRMGSASPTSRSGYSDLVIAARDGTLRRQVTANRPDVQPGTRAFVRSAYWAMDPAWSPVDDALVFVSDEGGWEPAPDEERLSDPLFLWYAGRSDAPPYLLPASARIGLTQGSPSFSPDGSKIAFVVRAGNGTQPKTELWTMTLDGGATSVPVSGDGSALDPTGAPDGKHIADIHRTTCGSHPSTGARRTSCPTSGAVSRPCGLPMARSWPSSASAAGRTPRRTSGSPPGGDGRLVASEPRTLFIAAGLAVPSGMSWLPGRSRCGCRPRPALPRRVGWEVSRCRR